MAKYPTGSLTPYGTVDVTAGTWERHGSEHNLHSYWTIGNDSATYGAVDPSGVALSRVAIQAMLDAADPYACITWPYGNAGQAIYRTDAAIVHPNKPLCHHAAPGGVVIKNTGTGDVWDSNGADNWTIDGLTFDSNYPTRTTGRCLMVQNSTSWRATNFRVQNCGEMGVVVRASSTFWLDRFTIDTCYRSGIYLAEGTGTAVENFWITDGDIRATNLSASPGHANIQCNNQSPGNAPLMAIRKGFFRDIRATFGAGFVVYGMDLLTDSVLENLEAYGSHAGEALALTGARNKVKGGRFGESTGAAGLLLWSWAGNDQDNADTEIAGAELVGPGSGNQGLALVAAQTGVTLRRLKVHDITARSWNYGIQSYPGAPGSYTLADDGTCRIYNNTLAGNVSGGYTFTAPFTPILRGNLTAPDTIDA